MWSKEELEKIIDDKKKLYCHTVHIEAVDADDSETPVEVDVTALMLESTQVTLNSLIEKALAYNAKGSHDNLGSFSFVISIGSESVDVIYIDENDDVKYASINLEDIETTYTIEKI